MTLYHFGNCATLVYVPYYLTYKYSGLSEYGTFWKCIQVGSIFIFTQLVKMLLLATFFPAAEKFNRNQYDFFEEFLKHSMDIADLAGILVVLNRIPGKGHAKVLTAGIGWAGAEVVFSRILILWVGARGAEFDWKYIQKSLESNICLVQHINTATLVWLWSRHDLKRSFIPIVIIILLCTVYQSFLLELSSLFFSFDLWFILGFKLISALLMCAVTLNIYTDLAQTIGIS